MREHPWLTFSSGVIVAVTFLGALGLFLVGNAWEGVRMLGSGVFVIALLWWGFG